MGVSSAFLDDAAAIVDGDPFHVSGPRIDILSADGYWLSPVLETELAGKRADVATRPSTLERAQRLLELAYRCRVPVVPRGRGTGNYGQAVPLSGGLVLDMSLCDRVLQIDADEIMVEAGSTFRTIDAVLSEHDREMPVMPSMLAATLGGFLAGGNQGIGSIEHGSTWDGWVRGLTVMPCRADASAIGVSSAEVPAYTHTYGTTGLLATIRIQTVPRRDRTVVFGAFARLDDAWAAGMDLMRAEIKPRAISLDEDAVYRALGPHPGYQGKFCLRIMTDAPDQASQTVARHAGTVTAEDDTAVEAMMETVYNHATLAIHRTEGRICAIQVRGPAIVAAQDQIRQRVPGARLHLDGNNPRAHGPGYSGLLYMDWQGPEALEAAMRALSELGVLVVNPHTYKVGQHGDVERILAVARQMDPLGLLNPGKLDRTDLAVQPNV